MSSRTPWNNNSALLAAGAAVLVLAVTWLLAPIEAQALSEIPVEEVAPTPEITTVPLPPPIPNPGNARTKPPEAEDSQDDDVAVEPEAEEPASEPTELPEIHYDTSLLPEPVRRMRDLIMEACKSGDVEALRPLLDKGEDATLLSFGGQEGDPVEFLKSVSGDREGHEILAILQEVLDAGYVHLEPGTESEIYVWPYFFAVPLEALTAEQRVELFRLVTAGDYEDMKNYGAYIFYRVGITPEGKWAFFVAGD